MNPTTLFTHLKIILLQYFQFSIFNFSNNKFNSNGHIDDNDYLYPRSGADVMRGWRNVFDAYVWGDA